MTLTVHHHHHFHVENDAELHQQLFLILKNTKTIMAQIDDLKTAVESLNAKADALQIAIDADQASDAAVVSNLKDQIAKLEAAAAVPATDPVAIQSVIDSMNATISKIEASTTDVAGPGA